MLMRRMLLSLLVSLMCMSMRLGQAKTFTDFIQNAVISTFPADDTTMNTALIVDRVPTTSSELQCNSLTEPYCGVVFEWNTPVQIRSVFLLGGSQLAQISIETSYKDGSGTVVHSSVCSITGTITSDGVYNCEDFYMNTLTIKKATGDGKTLGFSEVIVSKEPEIFSKTTVTHYEESGMGPSFRCGPTPLFGCAYPNCNFIIEDIYVNGQYVIAEAFTYVQAVRNSPASDVSSGYTYCHSYVFQNSWNQMTYETFFGDQKLVFWTTSHAITNGQNIQVFFKPATGPTTNTGGYCRYTLNKFAGYGATCVSYLQDESFWYDKDLGPPMFMALAMPIPDPTANPTRVQSNFFHQYEIGSVVNLPTTILTLKFEQDFDSSNGLHNDCVQVLANNNVYEIATDVWFTDASSTSVLSGAFVIDKDADNDPVIQINSNDPTLFGVHYIYLRSQYADQYTFSLFYTNHAKIRVEFTCFGTNPSDWVVDQDMPQTLLTYFVTSEVASTFQISTWNFIDTLCLVMNFHIREALGAQNTVDFITLNEDLTTITILNTDESLIGEVISYQIIASISDVHGNVIDAEFVYQEFDVEWKGINNPPQFQTALTTYHQIKKQHVSVAFTYTLPTVFDPDGHDVSISVDRGTSSSFVTYTASTNKIRIADLSSADVIEGEHVITVSLDDGREGSPVLFEITLNILEADPLPETPPTIGDEVEEMVQQETIETEETEVETGPKNEEEELEEWHQKIVDELLSRYGGSLDSLMNQKELGPMSGKYYDPNKTYLLLEDCDNQGRVSLKFTQEMQIIPHIEDLHNKVSSIHSDNRKAFNVVLIPGVHSDEEKLHFNWKATNMTSRNLYLEIDFQNVLHISTGQDPEILAIEINDPVLFISKKGDLLEATRHSDLLDARRRMASNSQIVKKGTKFNSYVELEIVLPPQIPKTKVEMTLQEAIDSAGQNARILLASNFVVNLILSASLNQMWSLINAQQIMVFMPLFNIIMPASAATSFQYIMSIAAFDIYELGDIYNWLLDLAPTEPKNRNFYDLGFESLYFLNNMGFLAIWFLLYSFVSILVFLLSLCIDRSRRMRKVIRVLRNLLFFDILITITNESYLIVATCCILAFPLVSFESKGLTIQSSSMLLYFTMIVFLVPTLMMIYICRRFDKLQTVSMRRKFFSLYGSLNHKKEGRKVLIQPIFFLLRRLVLALVVCHFDQYFCFQIAVIYVESYLAFAITNGLNVYKDLAEKRNENLNELCILAMTYIVLCFSPWIYELEVKHYMGYLAVFVIGSHLVYNIFLMIWRNFSGVIKALRMWKFKKAFASQREYVRKRIGVKGFLFRYQQWRKQTKEEKQSEWIQEQANIQKNVRKARADRRQQAMSDVHILVDDSIERSDEESVEESSSLSGSSSPYSNSDSESSSSSSSQNSERNYGSNQLPKNGSASEVNIIHQQNELQILDMKHKQNMSKMARGSSKSKLISTSPKRVRDKIQQNKGSILDRSRQFQPKHLQETIVPTHTVFVGIDIDDFTNYVSNALKDDKLMAEIEREIDNEKFLQLEREAQVVLNQRSIYSKRRHGKQRMVNLSAAEFHHSDDDDNQPSSQSKLQNKPKKSKMVLKSKLGHKRS